MPHSKALYYPYIDIHDEHWLKNAFLYWDELQTIVPKSYSQPYSTDTALAFEACEFLKPYEVDERKREVKAAAKDFMAYLDTPDGMELLSGGSAGQSRIHLEKVPYELERMVRIHRGKMPPGYDEILDRIVYGIDGDWILMHGGLANYYMSLLASHIADNSYAALVSPLAPASRLALTSRLGVKMQPSYGNPFDIPPSLEVGLLSHLAIQSISIGPDCQPEKLIKFKNKHRDELLRFRKAIEDLAVEGSKTSESLECLQQRVKDIYEHHVHLALTDLQGALKGSRIEFIMSGWTAVSFLSSSAMLQAAGFSQPTALLAGAGISLVVNFVKYNLDKRNQVQKSPYSYLLSMRRELA